MMDGWIWLSPRTQLPLSNNHTQFHQHHLFGCCCVCRCSVSAVFETLHATHLLTKQWKTPSCQKTIAFWRRSGLFLIHPFLLCKWSSQKTDYVVASHGNNPYILSGDDWIYVDDKAEVKLTDEQKWCYNANTASSTLQKNSMFLPSSICVKIP